MNHLYISWESWYTASTESVLALQLNFDSNAQIKKQNKNRGTLTFFVSKMFEEKKWSDPVLRPFGFLLGAVFHGKIIEKHREMD
jgi:hypothetical protein